MSPKTLNTAILILAFFALLCPLGAVSQAAAPAPELQAVLQSSRSDEEIPVIVTLRDDVNPALFASPDKNVRRRLLVQALKDQADLKHKPLIDMLESRGVNRIHSLWIINGLALRASPVVIEELAGQPEVESIRLDRVVTVPPVTSATPAATPEWNIDAIHAPDLWNLGYIGQGVVVANMDTGVDLNHPDLKDKWRGGSNSWYDVQGQYASPDDPEGHGTGTMGIMVGGSAGGTAIGVAPGAKWIAVKIFDANTGQAQVSDIHKGFQWLLNPDGNPATNDAPDVVNNSWALDNAANPCDTEFAKDIQALEQSGIAVIFSGGNNGPAPSTSLPPANNPGNFSVGATDDMSVIAGFSSRGPSCDGSIYPTVVAPGVNVKTADRTNGGTIPYSYNVVSGTSFSSPHAAGAIALLLSAFPASKVADLESTLEKSALDLGTPGADNTYGNGLLDVSQAYAMLHSAQAQPPVAVNDAYSTAQNTTLVLTAPGVLSNDKGNGPLTAVLVQTVSHGSLVLNSAGSFTYQPSAGFSGTDSFTYQANNGTLSNVATVTITVGTPPVAVNHAYVAARNTRLVVAAPGVLKKDRGKGHLKAVLVQTVSHGSLALHSNGSFTYRPSSGFTGPDMFTYQADDGTLSNVATVTITVKHSLSWKDILQITSWAQPPFCPDSFWSFMALMHLLQPAP
ncbi:MAG: S8 family serine peptidase [Syntrophobacteraceae bacterium]